MADKNASDELPGSVPGQFPSTPGETPAADDTDYIKDRTPFKPAGSGDAAPTPFPGGGAAGTYTTKVDGASHQRHRSFGRPAATHGKPTSHGDSSTIGRDAAIAGGAAGATGAAATGAFAYKESQMDDPVTDVDSSKQGTTLWRDADKSQQQEEDHTGRNTAIAGGAAAATGAAAYGAYEYKENQITDPVSDPDPDQKDYGAYERSGQGRGATEPEMEKKFATYDLNDPNPERTEAMKAQQRRTEEQKASMSQDDSNTGEYAAAGGVAAAGAGAAGMAATSSGEERRVSQTPNPDDFGGYERAGKGGIATEGELENKFATYEVHDANPEQTEAMKERIKEIEEQKAALGVEDQEKPGEKKGLLAKLGIGKSKDKSKGEGSSPRASEDVSSSAGQRELTEEEKTGLPVGNTDMSQKGTAADPHDEHLFIHGGDPNAPTLVVREKP